MASAAYHGRQPQFATVALCSGSVISNSYFRNSRLAIGWLEFKANSIALHFRKNSKIEREDNTTEVTNTNTTLVVHDRARLLNTRGATPKVSDQELAELQKQRGVDQQK
jgi:hypothetical protein